MRVILINLLFFLLPFIGYALFLLLTRGRLDAEETLNGKSFFWLVAAGTLCVVIGLATLTTFHTGSPDAVYVPSRYENGVLIPGGFREPGETDSPGDTRP